MTKKYSLLLLIPTLVLASCGGQEDPLALPNKGTPVTKEVVRTNYEESVKPVVDSGAIGLEVKNASASLVMTTELKFNEEAKQISVPAEAGNVSDMYQDTKTVISTKFDGLNLKLAAGGLKEESSSKRKVDVVMSGKASAKTEVTVGTKTNVSEDNKDANYSLYIRENVAYMDDGTNKFKQLLDETTLPIASYTDSFTYNLDFETLFQDDATYLDHGDGVYSITQEIKEEGINDLISSKSAESVGFTGEVELKIAVAKFAFIFDKEGPVSLGFDFDISMNSTTKTSYSYESKSNVQLVAGMKLNFLTGAEVTFEENIDTSAYPLRQTAEQIPQF